MSGTAQTIVISPADRQSVIRERLADEAISVGHLIEVTATGYQKHSTAAGNAMRIFADRNIADAGDLTRAYISGETVRGNYAQSGDEVLAKVAAAATAIDEGDFVESAGDGTVRVLSASAATSQAQRASVLGQAVEAVDNSGGASEVNIKIEVL